MTKAEAQNRWTSEAGKAVNAALAVNQFRKGGFQKVPALPGSVGVYEGRTDLRGLPMSAVIKGCVLENIDFSFMTALQFGQLSAHNEVRNCLFVDATFGTNLRDRFEKCDFTRANLRGAVLGREFTDCVFGGASLDKIMARETVFTRCSFRGSESVGAQMTFCKFIECDLSGAAFSHGSLAKAQFENCQGQPDLSNMML